MSLWSWKLLPAGSLLCGSLLLPSAELFVLRTYVIVIIHFFFLFKYSILQFTFGGCSCMNFDILHCMCGLVCHNQSTRKLHCSPFQFHSWYFYSHSNRFEVLSHHGVHFHFTNHLRYWISFHVLICHLQRLFWLSVNHYFFKYISSTTFIPLSFLDSSESKLNLLLIFHRFPRLSPFFSQFFSLLFKVDNFYWSVFELIGSSSIISILLLSPASESIYFSCCIFQF